MPRTPRAYFPGSFSNWGLGFFLMAMAMQGKLFKYGPKAIQTAFSTGGYSRKVVFLGGLTDGLLANQYLVPLADALNKEQWSLVQFLFSSSYSGYGTSSIQQDADELEDLVKYLKNEEESKTVVLLGHSTGCQDIVHYLVNDQRTSVDGAILQAPVSDREYRETLPGNAEMLNLAEGMVKQGQGLAFMPREVNPDAPITAERFYSLTSCMGLEDMFSSDLTDDQLRGRLQHMSRIPCQVIFSMADEYVPDHVDKSLLVGRLCEAMGGAKKVEIEGGNHSLSNKVDEVVDVVMDFIHNNFEIISQLENFKIIK